MSDTPNQPTAEDLRKGQRVASDFLRDRNRHAATRPNPLRDPAALPVHVVADDRDFYSGDSDDSPEAA